jgi:hypothetical protein
MPKALTHTVTGKNSIQLSWSQPNSLIDGFVICKHKNGLETFYEVDKDKLSFVDPVVLDADELTTCTDVNYSVYAKAGKFISATNSLPGALIFPQPTPANAGSDHSPAGLSVALNANAAGANESGTWTILSGTGGIIQEPAKPNSLFFGTAGSNYILRWSIMGKCTTTHDDITIAMPVNPVGTLVSANDCSSLTGVSTQYQALNGNTAAWAITSNGYSGSCFVAPDNTLGGLYGQAIGTHYIEFPIQLTTAGYIEFWKYSYYAGSPKIQPGVLIDGVLQNSPLILETQNTDWQKLRTANIAPGAHTVRIQFASQYYQLKVDEIKVYRF